MPYEVTIQEQQGYIRVDISGERISGQEEVDAASVWSQVADVCNAKQIDRILSISKITGRLPARAAHAIAYDPRRFGWSKRFKLALVNLNAESQQDFLFLEDVAVSSGYRVRVFDNGRDAKAWLLGK